MTKFMKREWPKGQHGCSSRQGLADCLMQPWFMAARQDEESAFPGIVHDALDVGKQGGKLLHFIQYLTAFHLAEESPRIGLGGHADIGVFKGKIGFAGKRPTGQRGLARLTWAQDCHHGIFGGAAYQLVCDVSLYHGSIIR